MRLFTGRISLMELKEILAPLHGNRRKYMLFRISGVEPNAALQLTGAKKNAYNAWLKKKDFVGIHQRIGELYSNYRIEAIRLLRRDNQLNAVILEGKVIKKMEEEVENSCYDLVKTNLGKEVYTKLLNDLDEASGIKNLTWLQRIDQMNIDRSEKHEVIEADYHEQAEHKESLLTQETSSKPE